LSLQIGDCYTIRHVPYFVNRLGKSFLKKFIKPQKTPSRRTKTQSGYRHASQRTKDACILKKTKIGIKSVGCPEVVAVEAHKTQTSLFTGGLEVLIYIYCRSGICRKIPFSSRRFMPLQPALPSLRIAP
jgi:hypothetical protein